MRFFSLPLTARRVDTIDTDNDGKGKMEETEIVAGRMFSVNLALPTFLMI